MAESTVVEKLIKHVEDRPSRFRYRLWNQGYNTPAAIAGAYRRLMQDASSELCEDDYCIEELIDAIIDDLDSSEIFELGSALLAIQEKFLKG